MTICASDASLSLLILLPQQTCIHTNNGLVVVIVRIHVFSVLPKSGIRFHCTLRMNLILYII